MSFNELLFVFIVFYFISVSLYIYLQINIKSNYINKSTNSKIHQNNINKIIPNDIIIRVNIVVLILIQLFLTTYNGYSGSVWFGHIIINNINLFLLSLFLIIFTTLFLLLNNKIISIKSLQFDYFFSVSLLNISLPIIFFSSNMLTFFFIIELVSCLILFQFVIGRDWESLISTKKSIFFNYSTDNKSTSFVNIIFFQYWVSFFSSVLLVYTLLMFLYYYGTTEWVILNFLSSFDFNNANLYFNINLYFIFIVFLIAFFLKLGIAPAHFYKIELYKSLPFITILLYTIYFFFIFFIFFGFIITNYLIAANVIWFNCGVIIISFGIILVSFLLFDITSLKAFFAYSTIVNSMAFFSLLISLV